MTEETLADRFVNYSDAVAAFSIVNATAFLIALSELEVRCSLSNAGPVFLLVFPSWAAMQSGLLFVCRRAELALRAGAQPAPVARLLGHLVLARHALVWIITLGTMLVALSAARDPACVP